MVSLLLIGQNVKCQLPFKVAEEHDYRQHHSYLGQCHGWRFFDLSHLRTTKTCARITNVIW
jgi:hypothetical protein